MSILGTEGKGKQTFLPSGPGVLHFQSLTFITFALQLRKTNQTANMQLEFTKCISPSMHETSNNFK